MVAEVDQKRMRMRSWRRGTKEMDMILGPYADAALAHLSDDEFAEYEALLNENDQDLYLWFSRKAPEPEVFEPILKKIRQFHGI